jgi:hypothetical protein
MPEEIPATCTRTGKRCTVSVRTLPTVPPSRAFSVGPAPAYLLSPNYCQDDLGRLIRVDVLDAFGEV